jgi:nicotinamidase-related amidase
MAWRCTFHFPHALEGTGGAELIPELEPSSSNLAITSRRRYSAFFQTDLDPLLRSLAIKILIMAGVSTDVFILATASDAHARDYCVVVVKERVSGFTPQEAQRSTQHYSACF